MRFADQPLPELNNWAMDRIATHGPGMELARRIAVAEISSFIEAFNDAADTGDVFELRQITQIWDELRVADKKATIVDATLMMIGLDPAKVLQDDLQRLATRRLG